MQHQFGHVVRRLGNPGHAQADLRLDHLSVPDEGPAQHLRDAVEEQLRLLVVGRAARSEDIEGESVAAQARRVLQGAGQPRQARGHLGQQDVARRVAVQGVDLLAVGDPHLDQHQAAVRGDSE